jgi:hypothetical protein
MVWLKKVLDSPVEESKVSYVLVMCVVAMSVMLVALVWQNEIIAGQRDVIRWLEHVKLGS